MDQYHGSRERSYNPQKVFLGLITLFPDFNSHWNVSDSGDSATYCTILSEFSRFLDTSYSTLDEEKKMNICQWVESALTDPNPEKLFLMSLKTCFLENIVHLSLASDLINFMGSATYAYFSSWDKDGRFG